MSNEEKKNSGLLKKIGIPAAVAAIILLLGINAFSVYKYFSVKADNDKLYAQNEEYEDSILRLSTLNEQQSDNTANNSGSTVCGNPNCMNNCQGTCTGDCQGNCGNCCVNSCAGSCVAYNGACPWDDEAWLDKFADIIAGKRMENQPEPEIEEEDADLTAENDADEEISDEDSEEIEEDEDFAASNKNKKASAKRSTSRSAYAQNGLTVAIDPALQLYYQLMSSPEYQRQLAYYNAVRRGVYANYYNYGSSNTSSNSSSDNKSSSHSSSSSSNSNAGSKPGASTDAEPDPENPPSGNEPGGNEPGGNEPGGNEPGGNEPGGEVEELQLPEYLNEFWHKNLSQTNRSTALKNSFIASNDIDNPTVIVSEEKLYENWNTAYDLANDPQKDNKKHTMIIYMLASDLEGSKNGVLTSDLTALLRDADYDTDKLNIVLCVGAAEEFQNEYMKKYVDADTENGTSGNQATVKNTGGCAMFYVNPDGQSTGSSVSNEDLLNDKLIYLGNIADNSDANKNADGRLDGIFCSMYDPATLTTAIDIASTGFPADEYSLIMWDHGAGIIDGFGTQYVLNGTDANGDPKYEQKNMSVAQIVQALNDTKIYKEVDDEGNHGKFTYIGFDACLMGGVETVAALEPYADYCVASAEITSYGWDYADIANYIAPIVTGGTAEYIIGESGSKALAQKTAEIYAAQPEHQVNYSCTDHVVACVELEGANEILDSIDEVAAIINDLPYGKTGASGNDIDENDIKGMLNNAIHNARAKAYSYGLDKVKRSDVSYDYVDIKDFFSLLKDELDGVMNGTAYDDDIKTLISGGDYNAPGFVSPGNSLIGAVNNLLSKLESPAITQAYANWLGYNNYDEDNETLDSLGKVAGSNIGGLSMYMPYMNVPEVYDSVDSTKYAGADYVKYVDENYNSDNYNQFLNNYLVAESARQSTMKEGIAQTIDYNKIFKAKARILMKDGNWAEYYDDNIEDNSGNPIADGEKYGANKNKYASNVDSDNIASTVIRLMHTTHVPDYGDDNFVTFKDTVNKITAVTTKKIMEDDGVTPTNYDLVVAKKDVELADISAKSEDITGSDSTDSVDIGIYDYSRAESYMVSGTALTVNPAAASGKDSLVDISASGSGSGSSESALDKYEHTDDAVKDYAASVASADITGAKGLMDGMREKLLTSNNDEETGFWLEVQGKITEWIDGAKSKVEAAILHFRADEKDGEYKFYGASTITEDVVTGEQGYAVLDSDGNPVQNNSGNDKIVYISSSRTSDDLSTPKDDTGATIPDVAYTISFYHYVVGGFDNTHVANSDTENDKYNNTNRYMYVTTSDANDAPENESLITDDNSLYTYIPITQPEYDPADLKITIEHLVAYDPTCGNEYRDENDAPLKDSSTNQPYTPEEIASMVYENNSEYGYGALIESTAGQTTAVAPVYVADSAADNTAHKPYNDIGEAVSDKPLPINPSDDGNSVTKSIDDAAPSAEVSSTDVPAVSGVDSVILPETDNTGQLGITTDILLPDMPVAGTDMPFDQQTMIIEVPNTSDRLSDVINTAIASVPEEPKYDAVPSQGGSSDGGSDPEPSGGSEDGGQESAPESDAGVED